MNKSLLQFPNQTSKTCNIIIFRLFYFLDSFSKKARHIFDFLVLREIATRTLYLCVHFAQIVGECNREIENEL